MGRDPNFRLAHYPAAPLLDSPRTRPYFGAGLAGGDGALP
jgi:hypothetical protein